MKAFKFRLEKVLEMRVANEKAKRDALMQVRRSRYEAENVCAGIAIKMQLARACTMQSVREHLSLGDYLTRLQDELASAEGIVQILLADEDVAETAWIEARKELRAIEHIKTSRKQAWTALAIAEEQKALDEHAITRRAA